MSTKAHVRPIVCQSVVLKVYYFGTNFTDFWSRNEREAIESYFHRGHTYVVILLFLNLYHGIKMSLRTLKRRVAQYGLSRRRASPLGPVWNAIQQELEGPGNVT